jgi:hypothetical protein
MSTNTTNDINNDKCPICQDFFKYPIELNCKHQFCFLCIKFAHELSPICPLCRSPITTDLSAISMNEINVTLLNGGYPCTKWLFSSRDERSWWYYDECDSNVIEHAYQNWNDEHQRIVNQQDTNNSDGNVAQPTIQQFDITIGPYPYIIDFERMEQISTDHQRRRKIMRKTFNNLAEKTAFDGTIRGVVGIYFNKH